MGVNFLIDRFEKNKNKDALVWNGKIYNYGWLVEKINYWIKYISDSDIKKGSAVVVESDFSPNSVSLFIALLERKCIFIPISKTVSSKKDEFLRISKPNCIFTIDDKDEAKVTKIHQSRNNYYYHELNKRENPGLVLFSSGSTGESKASVHDMSFILEKFILERNSLRTITFLLYDHIGGVNTLLYTLSNVGFIVTANNRNPDSILELVEKYKVELLPTSPTFINLILLSEAYKRHDMSSLKMITYGTEPMPKTTLETFNKLFPDINLLQTYGLSEVGILRSKSESPDSLWVKVGGEGFQTRVVNDMLEIKAKSAMLGYLNAPSPFTKDGWLMTGDLVKQKGEYIKILGRKSEIINVGGEKVYPQEVENIILQLDNVAEATVYGERNPLVGNIVCVKIKLLIKEDESSFIKKLKLHCNNKIERYKIPIKVYFSHEKQYSDRFKKQRKKV